MMAYTFCSCFTGSKSEVCIFVNKNYKFLISDQLVISPNVHIIHVFFVIFYLIFIYTCGGIEFFCFRLSSLILTPFSVVWSLRKYGNGLGDCEGSCSYYWVWKKTMSTKSYTEIWGSDRYWFISNIFSCFFCIIFLFPVNPKSPIFFLFFSCFHWCYFNIYIDFFGIDIQKWTSSFKKKIQVR